MTGAFLLKASITITDNKIKKYGVFPVVYNLGKELFLIAQILIALIAFNNDFLVLLSYPYDQFVDKIYDKCFNIFSCCWLSLLPSSGQACERIQLV
ncbi:MAG: hypothetical protein JST48_11135 [Bacteroidetes bacterium]|nr:hypothetical protein [Bacteroidota bacterium]